MAKGRERGYNKAGRERETGLVRNRPRVSFINLEYREKSTAAEEGY